jgi:hypothetical protein
MRNAVKHKYIFSLNQYIFSSSNLYVATNYQAGHKRENKYKVMFKIEIRMLYICIV